MDVNIVANENVGGYQLKMTIPWSEIRGIPEDDQGIGYNITLQSRSESTGTLHK